MKMTPSELNHSLIGFFHIIAAIAAGVLLGDTTAQSVGIFCALYCLMPVVYDK